MTPNTLIGHAQVVRYLDGARQRNELAHAYLLQGPEHVGKATLVREFLQGLFCEAPPVPCGRCAGCCHVAAATHPDVWWVQVTAGKTQVGIEDVRELIRFTQLTSLTGPWRVVVLPDVAALTPEAANALLKVLEEPGPGVLFFLLDHHHTSALATLRSRCVLLELGPVPARELVAGLLAHGVPGAEAEELSRLAAGLPGLALSLWADPTVLERAYGLAQVCVSLFTPGTWPTFQRFIETTHGQAAREGDNQPVEAMATVSVWLEVARDVLLVRLGLPSAVRYQKLDRELHVVAERYSVLSLLKLCGLMRRALQKLQANANPRLTLEWLGLSISHL